MRYRPSTLESIVRSTTRHPNYLIAVSVFWLVVVLGGFYVVIDYDTKPAPAAALRNTPLPAASPTPAGRWRLEMFVHPRCACSRASIAELARIVETTHDAIDAEVFFIAPGGTSADWTKTELWEAAAALPHVTPIVDQESRRAEKLGAITSGQTLLYDPTGHLVFSGGITGARGHFGANSSSRRVIELVEGQRREACVSPVFGCPLTSPSPPNVK